MASSSSSSLHPNPTTFLNSTFLNFPPKTKPSSAFTVRCGPRDKRGPLVKGRVLSIEAIQAVQTLKRGTHKPSTDPSLVTKTLSRLIKSDLVAALKELLRQDQCHLALQAFSVFLSEYRADVSLYAEVVLALARNGMADEIDSIVCEMETGVGVLGEEDDKGTARLIRAVVGAERRESTVMIYAMLKRSGWGSQGFKADEYVVKVLGKGLRRLGEVELAAEVDAKFGQQISFQS